MSVKRKKGGMGVLAAAVIAIGILFSVVPESASLPESVVAPTLGRDRIVSVQHLPELCPPVELPKDDPFAALSEEDIYMLQQQRPSSPLVAALGPVIPLESTEPESLLAKLEPQAPAAGRPSQATNTTAKVLSPTRTIRDLDPSYSAVGINTRTNEVILQDNNLWSTRIFDRLTNTPANLARSEEKRVIQGEHTDLQFNNGLYIDPVNGDIFSVESDVGDKMTVFAESAKGDVAPKRKLHTGHRVYNLAVDESRQELYMTIEFPSEIHVYRKEAEGEELPLRRLVGPHTGLNSIHGIAVDEKNQLLYVNNWGHISDFRVQGTGKYEMPSIKVYPLGAAGDTPPLRVITGDKTQLNWPAAMKLNPENGDLYVANDIGQAVLVFANAPTANGNVAPVRVITGPKTTLSYPTGVALDLVNREVWVSNMGSASAAVFPLMANGDMEPLRKIRSAPTGKRSLNFGRTAAVAYDAKRQQILVPNCVNHPQIAVFDRLAKENTPFIRSIEGQKSLLARTMHDFAFDNVHDEIVVTSPLAQAILTFRGDANGEVAPLRIIQGAKTGILGVGAVDKVTSDDVHGEYYITTPNQEVLVYSRESNGDVPPIRILKGPDTGLSVGRQKEGIFAGKGGNPSIKVDPIHNLLLVPVNEYSNTSGALNESKILVFARTAQGNTKPLAAMYGAGLGAIYPEKQRVIDHNRGSLQVWNIPTSGEVRTPIISIACPLEPRASGGVMVLDPAHKEVILATAAANTIVTYYVPEAFD